MFKISDKTVDNYVERGVFKRVEKSKYDIKACVSGYIDMINARADKPETLKDLESIKLKLQIEKQEMENEERRGNLIKIQDRDREFYELARLTRDNVLNIIPRVVPRVAVETDEKRVSVILETEIKKALKTLAEKLIG